MKKYTKGFLFAVSLTMLGGCASIRYTFNNENYNSGADALAAQTIYIDKLLADVKVRDKSINAKVLVISPNQVTIEALGIKRTGTPKQEIIDYIKESSEKDFQSFGRALKKSMAFTQVELKVSEHPLKDARQEAGRYAAVVYLHLVSPTQMGWYMIKGEDGQPTNFSADPITKGAERSESWIDNAVSVYKRK